MPTHPSNPLMTKPKAVRIAAQSTSFSFVTRATPPGAATMAAVRGRKPLRPRKERLPSVAIVNPELVVGRKAATTSGEASNALAPQGPEASPTPAPDPELSFDGGADDGTSIPPDTTGAVSHRHVLEGLNNNVVIFSRTGERLSEMTLDRFWDVFDDPVDAFDPRAVWDPFAERFIFVSTANAQRASSKLLIAATKSDDPTGEWVSSAVGVDPELHGTVWLDYPSVGFSADKITVQVNLFTLADNAFAGSTIYVWDKSSLIEPPYQPEVRTFTLREDGACQVPAFTYDPGETSQYLVATANGDFEGSGYYSIYQIHGSVADGTVALSPLGYIEASGTTWANSMPADAAPQSGTKKKIDAGDDRLLSVVLRRGRLWFSHAAFLPSETPGRSVAQWLQVDTSDWSVLQFGQVTGNGKSFLAFPTLAVNANEDALIGFSVFSPKDHPSGGYAFRAATDPPGSFRSIQRYAKGGSTYFKVFGGSKNRWGDYSATQVDPVDDLSFWTVQEMSASEKDMWATRWAKVR